MWQAPFHLHFLSVLLIGAFPPIIFQILQKGIFFFIVLQAGFAAHLLLLGSRFIFKNACVGQGLYVPWGHIFAPCPFGFNPSLAMAGAGRGEAVAQLLESLVWNPGWELFFHHFLRKSLNQGLTLQGAGQQEMDSAKAMHTMCKGWFKQQRPPNHPVGNFAHAGVPQEF